MSLDKSIRPPQFLVRGVVRVLRQFIRAQRGGPTIEFALSALGLIAFIFALINIGLLGFSIAAMDHGVQAAARRASVEAANSYETSSPQAYSCDANTIIAGYFDSYADPPLGPSGVGATSNPKITATWVNNTGGGLAHDPPGLYLTLTATYTWAPIGLALTNVGFTLSYTTLAMVTGTMQNTPTIGASC